MAQGFWDGLFSGIGEAIADIRHRVVEEGWFGHHTTDDASDNSFYRPIMSDEAASFDALWAPRELPIQGQNHDHEIAQRDHGGIDR